MNTVDINKKIVVIDDDASVQEVVRAYLEKDGYLVYVAGTGAEGLALAEHVTPGLIVLDLMLPDRSGEDIARDIHLSHLELQSFHNLSRVSA